MDAWERNLLLMNIESCEEWGGGKEADELRAILDEEDALRYDAELDLSDGW